MEYDIRNIKLSEEGKRRIEWADRSMPVLRLIRERFRKGKPLKGIRIGTCLHVTDATANLIRTLKAGGAEVTLCASNPLSTQDDIAASLVKDYKIPVFAIKGENDRTYYEHIRQVLKRRPQITMDDGADLVAALMKLEIRNLKLGEYKIRDNKGNQGNKKYAWNFYGSSEETTTGVIRLKAMEKDGVLKIPVVAVNDSYTKYMFDNRYGTGQSTVDGILRATNILLAGKRAVVCGYGWCGKGLAARLRGMGANVVVCEVDPIRALEATMDGFIVKTLEQALKFKLSDLIVTTTGNKHVVDKKHFVLMQDGTILANSGHFNVEINMSELERMAVGKKKVREYVVEYRIKEKGYRGNQGNKGKSGEKRIYVLGEGRLVNLVAAEGHPPEVMDMSFANQALAAEWFVRNKGKLEPKVYKLPEKLDKMVAKLKLEAMGVKIDRLTKEQRRYLESWEEGT